MTPDLLIVDDQPDNLQVLSAILESSGYKVRKAINGKFALKVVQLQPPDLILLDVLMPEMGGYEVCQRLKQDPTTCDIPVIFLSALSRAENKVKGFQVGGADYIAKPFQAEEVLARLTYQLDIRSLQARLRQHNQQLGEQNERLQAEIGLRQKAEAALQRKNEELEGALHELQATQSELIHAEKMSALGQSIAGIVHEINNPLCTIRSATGIADRFLRDRLEAFSDCFSQLSPQQRVSFRTLLDAAMEHPSLLNAKERRQLVRELSQKLHALDLEPPSQLADLLVELGASDRIEAALPLLEGGSDRFVQLAYDLAEVSRSLGNVRIAAERATDIVGALKNYARYDASGQKVRADITEGIQTVLMLFQYQFKQKIEVETLYGSLPAIQCYPDELSQVWTNLVHNALQAMGGRGTLSVETRECEDKIEVCITDSGSGISPEVLPRIFEPFFTTKARGKGTGIGLHISQKIVEKHGGTIAVKSIPGKTCFTVCLPIAS
ncbi:MAG: response regulator [Cyanobacteriota bacterium]|nr:response regulator [Cyanobacteriota bacterium]